MHRGTVLLGLCVGLYFLLKAVLGKWRANVQDPKNSRFAAGCFILFILLIIGLPEFGSKTPGSIWERSDYEGRYVVLVYPGKQTANGHEAVGLIECDTESGTDQGDETYSTRTYKIDHAIMPNGSRISFNPDSYESLKVNKVVRLSDSQGNIWGVKLTPQSVSAN